MAKQAKARKKSRKWKPEDLTAVCRTCRSAVHHPCLTESGQVLTVPHAPRKCDIAALKSVNKFKGLRGELPGQYVIEETVRIPRDSLSPKLSEDERLKARIDGRDTADHYIVRTVLTDGVAQQSVKHNGNIWMLDPPVADALQRQRAQLETARKADAAALGVLERQGIDRE